MAIDGKNCMHKKLLMYWVKVIVLIYSIYIIIFAHFLKGADNCGVDSRLLL